MRTTEITTTNISVAFKKELKKMATSYGKTQMAFLHDCIFYFKSTGMNPSIVEPYSPQDAISKLAKSVNTSISFFQKFEKEKIQPLLDQLIIASSKLSKSIEYTISKDDLKEIKQTIELIGHHQQIITQFMNATGDFQVNNFEPIKDALKDNAFQQKKTQEMIEIFFQAMTSGTGGINQKYIELFNEKLKI